MEDNEVELKDAKPGMWATFDVPEPIDNSYVHVEPGHYEGAILEPTEGHILEEMVFSIFYGHDVVRLCIDGSAVGLEKGKPYTCSSSSRTRNLPQALLRTFTSIRPNQLMSNLNHMRTFHAISRDSTLIWMVVHGVLTGTATLCISPMIGSCSLNTRVTTLLTSARSVKQGW